MSSKNLHIFVSVFLSPNVSNSARRREVEIHTKRVSAEFASLKKFIVCDMVAHSVCVCVYICICE